MNPSSKEYRELLGNRDIAPSFTDKANIKLKDGTTLTVTEADIVRNGLKINDSVSNGNGFQVGSAIINSIVLMLNNIGGKFNQYDFTDAEVIPFAGARLSNTLEWFKKGVFTVNNPTLVNSIISLECVDNMNKFDVPFADVQLIFPCTQLQLLQAVCLHCGVPLSTIAFLNSNFAITRRPSDEATTCREIVAYIAQNSGNFARCNKDGALELKWYDFGVFEAESNLDGGKFDITTEPSYQSGDNADGGDFTYSETTNYDGGTFLDMARYHHIYALTNTSIATDDVIITGVRVKAKGTESDYGETVLFGSEGFVIEIENPLIIEGTASVIANSVGQKIVGMKFRPCSISANADPSREAGDVGYLSYKNEKYQILFTGYSYSIGSQDNIRCEAETPSKNKSVQFNALTKALVESREVAKQEINFYDLFVQQLTSLIANGVGMFTSVVEDDTGGKTCYTHDKPTLAESTIRWYTNSEGQVEEKKINGAWTIVSATDNEGNALYNVLTARGINAEWIKVLTYFTVGNNFSVDSLGKLIASDAEIRGKIIATLGEIAGMMITSQGFMKVTTTDSDTFIGEINLNDGRFNMSFNNNLNTIGCGVNTFYDDDGSPILNLYSRDANGLRNDNILLNGFSVLDMLNSHAAKLAKIENYLADRFDYEI